MRLMALDGFILLDLADTADNERAFGRPGPGRPPRRLPAGARVGR